MVLNKKDRVCLRCGHLYIKGKQLCICKKPVLESVLKILEDENIAKLRAKRAAEVND